jgi:ArsR family transcriptional regulator, arsenate/arsenite/antimonite-responsive transcriptional repressor
MDRSKAEKVSKALADATRLSILEDICAKKKVTCTDLVNLQGITPATVSHHLKVLADAGLIECQREGPYVQSQAIEKTIEEYMRFLSRLTAHKSSR